MTAYLNSMKANDLPISEYTLTGWINADLLVTGIRAAAQADGEFDRKSVVDAINALPIYSAGGIVPGYRLGQRPRRRRRRRPARRSCGSTGPPRSTCPRRPTPRGRAWTRRRSTPTTAKLKSFGDEDTGLSTEGVQGTETPEETGGTAEQPADPAKATADVQALVVKYLAAQTIDERFALTANGESIREQATKTFRAGLQLEPLNIKVTFTGKTTADVTFGIKLNGTELTGHHVDGLRRRRERNLALPPVRRLRQHHPGRRRRRRSRLPRRRQGALTSRGGRW